MPWAAPHCQRGSSGSTRKFLFRPRAKGHWDPQLPISSLPRPRTPNPAISRSSSNRCVPRCPMGPSIGPTHAVGPDLGDGPSEVTVVMYDTWADRWSTGRRGGGLVRQRSPRRRGGGRALHPRRRPPAGTPVAQVATPVAADPRSGGSSWRSQLVTTLDDRIATVLAGGTSDGHRPLRWPIIMLPLDQLVDDLDASAGWVQVGHRSAAV